MDELKLARKEAIKKLKQNYSFAAEEFDKWRNDEKVALEAIKKYGWNMEYISKELTENKEFAIKAITKSKHPLILQYFPNSIKDNEDIVKVAIEYSCFSLQYVSDRLKDNEQIVNIAIERNFNTLSYASDRLKDNKDYIMNVVTQNGGALQYASENLQDNPEVVYKAVSNYEKSIKYASERIQEMCKDKDPIQVLESYILNKKLQNSLSQKIPEKSTSKKLKI